MGWHAGNVPDDLKHVRKLLKRKDIISVERALAEIRKEPPDEWLSAFTQTASAFTTNYALQKK